MKQLLPLFALAAASLPAQTLTTATINRYFNPVRANIEAAAEAMPADKYNYKLTPDQMSFSEWLLHSVERNYQDCATLKGEKIPMDARQVAVIKGKEAVSKAVKESFAYCAVALQAMDDNKAVSTPEIAIAFLHTVVHNNEIYGNMVGYLRINGILPPSTERMRQMMKGKK